MGFNRFDSDEAPSRTGNGPRRFYDMSRGRLIDVHANKNASDGYWEHHWSQVAGDKLLKSVHTPNNMVIRVTKKYLAPSTKILEGGCGLGQNVWGLQRSGYEVWRRQCRSYLGACPSVGTRNAVIPR